MKKKQTHTTQNKQNKVEIEGKVVDIPQPQKFTVEIEVQSLTYRLETYLSGKMRKYYKGKLNVGDKVMVEIDVPYIDKGRITRKLNSRFTNIFNSGQAPSKDNLGKKKLAKGKGAQKES